jgi:hypothetical protein
MILLPANKNHAIVTTVWVIFALLCAMWMAGNVVGLVSPDSWIAKNNMPKPPVAGWPAEILLYFSISMIASLIFPILFCFITLYGLIKRRIFSLFTGYISLSTSMFTNLVFTTVTIRCGSMDQYFLFKFVLMQIIELFALVYLTIYTRDFFKNRK